MTMQSNFTWSKALGTGAEVQATSAATAPRSVQPSDRLRLSGIRSHGSSITCSSCISLTGTSRSRARRPLAGRLDICSGISPPAADCRSPLAPLTAAARRLVKATRRTSSVMGFRRTPYLLLPPTSGQGSRHFVSGNGIGTSGLGGANLFADPAAALNNIRQPILGYDTRDGGFGVYRGMPYWNVDLSVKKMFKITERFSVEVQVVFTNLFNHDQFGDPSRRLTSTPAIPPHSDRSRVP